MTKRRDSRSMVYVPPPDGGWGWVCVLGCGMAHFFLAGIARSFGIIYVVLREQFYSSAAVTAWIGALYNVMRFCGGPIAAALVNRFRFRLVVISGGILMCVGFLISAVSPNIMCMFFSYGLMTGFGASLVFAPSYIIVSQYFDKKKGRAMGFSTVGSGFGGLCVPFILKGLLDAYGYFGAMLNMGAIMLNCCVIGALYRSLEPTRRKKSETPIKYVNGNDTAHVPVSVDIDVLAVIAEETEPTVKEDENPEQNEDRTEIDEEGRIRNEDEERADESLQKKQLLSDTDSESGKKCDSESENQTQEKRCEKSSSDVNFDIKDKYDNEKAASNSVDDSTVVIATRHVEIEEVQMLTAPESPKPKKKIFDVALLSNRTFVLYGFMIMSLSITQQTFNIFIVAICKERGIAVSMGVVLAAISGFADMVGRFISGFIFDLKQIRSFRRLLLPVLLIIGAVCEVALPLFSGYLGIAFMSAGMGTFVAAAHAQRATVLTDFLDKSRTANAVGFTIWFQGIGQLFGPAFAGFLRDMSGDHDSTFYFGGCITVVTSLLYLLESFVTWKFAKTSGSNNTEESHRSNTS